MVQLRNELQELTKLMQTLRSEIEEAKTVKPGYTLRNSQFYLSQSRQLLARCVREFKTKKIQFFQEFMKAQASPHWLQMTNGTVKLSATAKLSPHAISSEYLTAKTPST